MGCAHRTLTALGPWYHPILFNPPSCPPGPLPWHSLAVIPGLMLPPLSASVGRPGSRFKSSSTPGPTSRSFRPSTAGKEEVRTEVLQNPLRNGRRCRLPNTPGPRRHRGKYPAHGGSHSHHHGQGKVHERSPRAAQGPVGRQVPISSPASPSPAHTAGPRGVYGLWGGHPFCLHASGPSCAATVCDREWMSLDSALGVPSPSRMASCSSRSPRGDSRDSERKRPLGRVGRGIPQLPFSSTWKWVISANSPTFSCSSSTSARSFCCSSTVDKEQVSTLEAREGTQRGYPESQQWRGSHPRGSHNNI